MEEWWEIGMRRWASGGRVVGEWWEENDGGKSYDEMATEHYNKLIVPELHRIKNYVNLTSILTMMLI